MPMKLEACLLHHLGVIFCLDFPIYNAQITAIFISMCLCVLLAHSSTLPYQVALGHLLGILIWFSCSDMKFADKQMQEN